MPSLELSYSTARFSTCVFRSASRVSLATVTAIAALLATQRVSFAQAQHEHAHEGSSDHHSGLHFSHPLIAESPTPDTKVRLDGAWSSVDEIGGETTASVARLEAEYAFHRSFSIEVDVPYARLSPDGAPSETNLANLELGLKFANFAFENRGILLGYGLEIGIPTGNDLKGIGSDHIWELEPFFNVAYQRRGFELVGFGKVGVPFNQAEGEEIETELGYNFSGLYHASSRLQALVELDGETVLSGDESGETVLNLSPGIKVQPLSQRNFMIGASVGFPLTDHRGFDVRAIVSLFYHF